MKHAGVRMEHDVMCIISADQPSFSTTNALHSLCVLCGVLAALLARPDPSTCGNTTQPTADKE